MTYCRFKHPKTTPKGRQQHPLSNTEIGDEGQTIQVRIPPKRKRIFRIYHRTSRGQNRPTQYTSHMGLENTQENQGNSMFPRILQLLPRVHRRIQQNSQTTIRKNKEEVPWQLAVGRQRTTSIQRIKDKTHHSTSTSLLQPPRTDQNRNGGLKIRLFRDTITAMPGGKMETSCVPIQHDVGRRIQLRHRR